MILRISDPNMLTKIERLARAAGLSNEALVAHAIERLSDETEGASGFTGMTALLVRIDRIPDRVDAFEPLDWDSDGLPALYKDDNFRQS